MLTMSFSNDRTRLNTLSARAAAFYEFKIQFTAGRAVRVGLLGSVALSGL